MDPGKLIKSQKILLLGILFAFLSLCHSAFSQQYTFHHISLEEGLSQITVNSIFQDSQGYIWFGTQNGLNRFDAYSFQHYFSDPVNTNSLSHSWIWDIFEDRNRNLWVASWSGLNKLSPDRKNFTRYFPDTSRPGRIKGERPVSIQQDKYGMIWIGTWGGGLNMYNPEKDSFHCFSPDCHPDIQDRLPGNFVRKIFIDSRDNLWVGTWEGLWRGSLGENALTEFQYIVLDSLLKRSDTRVTSILEDPSGKIWVGTLGQGIFCIDNGGNILKKYRHETSGSQSIPSDNIVCMETDAQGKLWVGTFSQGIFILEPTTGIMTLLNHQPEDPASLSGNNINAIFTDKSGLVWIAANGLNIFSPLNNRFDRYDDFRSVSRKLEDIRDISAVCQDSSGRIWIGTTGKGLFCIETDRNRAEDPWVKNTLESLNTLNIGSIIEGDNQTIWLGTRGNGLIKIQPAERKITNILAHSENPESQGMNYINGLAFIPPSSLWIASYDQGLILYDTRKKTYKKFHQIPGDTNTFPANYLLRIYKDHLQHLWICSWGAGIIHFDPVAHTWRSFSHIPGDTSSLSDNIPHSFCETRSDNTRRIWIGTSKGLSCLELDTGDESIFRNFYLSDGLPGNVVNAILENKDGNLWISTNSGIACFDPGAKTFRVYNEKDGLQGREFNAGSGIRLKDGRFLFGGVNGFNVFYPDSIKASQYSPEIVLTSIKVFNDEVMPDPSSLELRLAYNENFISFEYASLDYQQPQKNQYKYQMVGIDKDWVDAGKRRFASYPDLKPGKYVFRIMGSNSEGIWSYKTAELKLVITPPFWQTWWFRSIAFLIIAGLIGLFINYRIQKYKEIEKLRVSIASDLHDDIGASLTRITVHSQHASANCKNPELNASLEKIGELSREVISSMSDIVWSIDDRNDSLQDMVGRMRDYAYNTLSEKDISVQFAGEGLEKNKKLDVMIRQNLFSIYKEAINNILKHSGAGTVKIKLDNSDSNFRMEIWDDGKGFNEETIKKGNGLNNMRMRAKRIGGSLHFENDHGTKIILQARKF